MYIENLPERDLRVHPDDLNCISIKGKKLNREIILKASCFFILSFLHKNILSLPHICSNIQFS